MIISTLIAWSVLFCAATSGITNAAPSFIHSEPQSFIVKLKSGYAPQAHLSSVKSRLKAKTRIGKATVFDSRVFRGYALELSPADRVALAGLDEVEYVEPDVEFSVASEQVQNNAPWGLQAITELTPFPSATLNSSQKLNYRYEVYDSTAGQGVDIYILDSGVYANHTELVNRVQRSPVFARYTTEGDVFGHGTHVAGIAAGTRYGVAKKARIIDVKVITDTGRGFASDIIQGLTWAVSNANATTRPCVFNLSLGGGTSTALDDAVTAAVNTGIHVVVAAGNGAVDAAGWSPARVPGVIAVGNIGIDGMRDPSSNFGGPIAVFAPGVNITSAGISGPTATRVDTGTSMAAPHAAGLVAYLLAYEGPRTPAEMKARIQSLALSGVLGNIPNGTVNLMLRNLF
ncbi:proteinase K [Ceratobasidium sp. AG-Ba]|nr:proteinase K [Ceratobasidium sp. AG-Ba]